MERALARAGRCTPCDRSRADSDAAVPVRGECPTDDQAWTPMKRLASVVEQAPPEETTMAEDGASVCSPALYCVARLKFLLTSGTHC